jgi:VPDSG-CTERM motif
MNKKWIKVSVIAVAAGSMIATANAVPTLVVDGVTEAVDNVSGDSNPLPGQVLWSGIINGWEVSEDFGIASPPDLTHGGTPAAPVIDVTFNAIYLGGGIPTLTLAFTADGLGPFSTAGQHTLGGTLSASGMTVAGAILVNGVPRPAFALGPFTTLAFSGSAISAVTGGSNSTVTIQTTITATQKGQFASGDEDFTVTPPTTRKTVPDGGTTLALFGLGLSGFALLRRKLSA